MYVHLEIGRRMKSPSSFSLRALIAALALAWPVSPAAQAPAGLSAEPYATSSLTSDLTLAEPVSNNTDGDVGVDLKYGITANITADLTYNTDFAQVEVDERQVNLTRFSLFFPEGQGRFDFGRGPFGGFGGGGGGSEPTIFYSRRIGLSGGEAVPIIGSGRG